MKYSVRQKNERIVMAMVAGFDDRKDFGTLIKAAIKICESRDDLVFLLIGDGPLLKSLKAIVPPKFLDKQILFTGKRRDIESILQIVDIGLLITYYEGISNSIIEYMATGKPVIATKGGGTVELVKDEVNGFLIRPRDEEQLIDKLTLLINDKNLRMEMGNRAFHWVREKFDINEKVNQYIALYQRLVNEESQNRHIAELH